MAGCVPWVQLRSLLSGKRGRKFSHRRSFGTDPTDHSGPSDDWSSWVGCDLLEAIRRFRQQSETAVQGFPNGDASLPLVDKACRIVDSILTGINDQMRGIQIEVEVKACQRYRVHPPPDRDREVTSLEVQLFTTSPLVGEIATRSRIALSALIAGRLRFALQAPPERPLVDPVKLWVDGLEMLTLPDCVCARTQLREEFGRNLTALTAYDWWEKNRHIRFPLQTSKFHRVVESLHEQPHMKMLGRQLAAESFWGYLHTTDLRIQVFNLHFDERARGGITVTAGTQPPRTPAEAADNEQLMDITKKLLQDNRSAADRLAPSGINVAAMLAGPQVGQPGACPQVIAKLLSPAQWWGPGEGGWHRWDESWLCTDKRDFLGRVVKQNGRIIWRERRKSENDTSKWEPPTPSASGSLETSDGKKGASPTNLILVVLILLLASILYYGY